MIPASVKVGHHVYAVLLCPKERMGEDFGTCEYAAQEILLLEGLKLPCQKETLLHEIMHACLYPATEEGEPFTEERIVNLLAGPLLHVLQANPELVEYLTQ